MSTLDLATASVVLADDRPGPGVYSNDGMYYWSIDAEVQLRECAAELRRLAAENEALRAENERITNCLKKANDQAEDFERRWYLVNDELAAIKALEPVATLRGDGTFHWLPPYPGPFWRDITLYAIPKEKP